MGVPTSPLLSGIYLQFLEHNNIYKILIEQNIIAYFRFVDDILIVYNTKHTDIDNILHSFNQLHPLLLFTLRHETGGNINFLDLTVHWTSKGLTASIFCKPTATDTIIHNESCHPVEHKLACVNYLVNRINTYPVTAISKEIETRTCQKILNANGFHYINIIDRINNKKAKNLLETNRDLENKMQKWF
jgi:hypothetical protein